MTLKEALKTALTILKQVMEEKLTDTNIEICTVSPGDGKFKIFNKEEMLQAVRQPAATSHCRGYRSISARCGPPAAAPQRGGAPPPTA